LALSSSPTTTPYKTWPGCRSETSISRMEDPVPYLGARPSPPGYMSATGQAVWLDWESSTQTRWQASHDQALVQRDVLVQTHHLPWRASPKAGYSLMSQRLEAPSCTVRPRALPGRAIYRDLPKDQRLIPSSLLSCRGTDSGPKLLPAR
jgi:hypothetical protein